MSGIPWAGLIGAVATVRRAHKDRAGASAPVSPLSMELTKMEHVDSTSDERTVNNTMRHQYKVLNDAEKANMAKIKDMGLEMHEFVSSLGSTRETSLAKTKIEEAVMWAVKHVTG